MGLEPLARPPADPPTPAATHHTHAPAAGAAVEQPCPMAAPEDYSISLHIAAVFILLGVSLLGSLAPVALHLSGRSRSVTTAVKFGTFFGACRPLYQWQQCRGRYVRPYVFIQGHCRV